MALERSQRELQDCFRPHPNPRSEQEVVDAQSLGPHSFLLPTYKDMKKQINTCVFMSMLCI
jgi:hypothetical protein